MAYDAPTAASMDGSGSPRRLPHLPLPSIQRSTTRRLRFQATFDSLRFAATSPFQRCYEAIPFASTVAAPKDST